MKRTADLILTVPLLILLSPLMGLIALAVRIKLGPPILFRQQRPGLHGKPFTIYKFRTMIDVRDEEGTLLPDADRLTGLGKFLRRSSLDELPELWNVIKGEMSLVGPRPLLMEYLPVYSEREGTRHNVRPGITGLAQISGRNRLPWDQRLELDAQYVERQSLRLDLYILTVTVWKAAAGRDVVVAPGTIQELLTHYRNKDSSQARRD